MLRDVVSVEPVGDYRLRVEFDDGVQGVVDIAQMVRFTGVFAPLRNPVFFAQARVHPELRTVCWPNDADLDSDVLYANVTATPISTGSDSH
jgi:hypothetical protein